MMWCLIKHKDNYVFYFTNFGKYDRDQCEFHLQETLGSYSRAMRTKMKVVQQFQSRPYILNLIQIHYIILEVKHRDGKTLCFRRPDFLIYFIYNVFNDAVYNSEVNGAE
jgi:hypothetical protein